MTELKISDDLAVTLFRDAFLKAIPQEQRDTIFQEAIGKLLKEAREGSNRYGYGRSWLSEMMQASATQMLQGIVSEYMRRPENAQKLQASVEIMCDKILEKMPEVVATITGKVLMGAIEKASSKYDE